MVAWWWVWLWVCLTLLIVQTDILLGGGRAVVSLPRCGQVWVELHPQSRWAPKVDHCLEGALQTWWMVGTALGKQLTPVLVSHGQPCLPIHMYACAKTAGHVGLFHCAVLTLM